MIRLAFSVFLSILAALVCVAAHAEGHVVLFVGGLVAMFAAISFGSTALSEGGSK